METILAKIKRFIPYSFLRLLEPTYHFCLAFLAALLYRFPSRKIAVIGVTGTKGKTTVVHLTHDILGSSGAKVASISSLRFRIAGDEEVNRLKMTMPGRFFIQRFLRRALKAGCKYGVLEVTSQGIAQFRHRFIRFSAAVMTNVAPEHIEAHGSFELYLRSKLDLFWRLPKDAIAVVNRDDRSWPRFASSTAAGRAFYSKEGIVANGKRWGITDVRVGSKGIEFEIAGQTMRSSLLGEFNFYNILAAAAVGLGRGIAIEKIVSAIEVFNGLPGRMEFIRREPFAVVVDYAHTPDSLKNVYTFLRESGSKLQAAHSAEAAASAGLLRRSSYGYEGWTKAGPSSKLICVLGSAGGGRDRWKRTEMGKIAAEQCDEVILTNEDPYDENPAQILSEIKSGITNNQLPVTEEILDRREAIHAALQSARAGDTVVITGKGAEPWIMGRGGEKIPWDDRRVAREELEKL